MRTLRMRRRRMKKRVMSMKKKCSGRERRGRRGSLSFLEKKREISAGSIAETYAVMHRVACAMLRMSRMR